MADDISRAEARPRTIRLVEEMRDVLKCEQAWAIAQRYLDEERAEGRLEGKQALVKDAAHALQADYL